MKLRLTEPQASIVEIHVLDSVHDDDREDWWPALSGRDLVFDAADAGRIADLLTEAANSEELNGHWWPVASRLAAKVRRCAS